MTSNVTVIVPTLGCSAILSDCLKSLLYQDMRPSEIIIVANGRINGVHDIIKHSPIQIHTLLLHRNEGFSKAVNKGIQANDSEFVLVLNDDAYLDVGCIRALMSTVKDESYGSFAPLVLTLDGSTIQSTGLMFSTSGYGNRSNRYKLYYETNPIDVFSACGAAALYRRSALQEVGLFNEDFFFLFEDLELGFRLQLRGHKCLFVPAAKVFHAGGFTAQRYFPLKVEQCFANALAVAVTCMPRKWLFEDKVRMTRLYLNLSRACFARGYGLNMIKGLLRFIKNLPRSFKIRKTIQDNALYDFNYLRQLLYHGIVVVNFPDGEERVSTN
jgi:GT2 family glycosyltransferase